MKTYEITCTSRMSKGMILTGDTLSGDTYHAREFIKTHWAGKWNGSAWIVNPELVVSTIAAQAWGFTRVLKIEEKIESPVVVADNHTNQVCPRCGTYCYGDCQAA